MQPVGATVLVPSAGDPAVWGLTALALKWAPAVVTALHLQVSTDHRLHIHCILTVPTGYQQEEGESIPQCLLGGVQDSHPLPP